MKYGKLCRFLQYILNYEVLYNQLRLILYYQAFAGNNCSLVCVGASSLPFPCRNTEVLLSIDRIAFKEAFWVNFL
jgi:hypothetical protein